MISDKEPLGCGVVTMFRVDFVGLLVHVFINKTL